MQPRRVEILPSFTSAYDELAPEIQQRVRETLAHFSERTADNSLRPEMKNGLDNVWGVRVTKGYRAFYKKLRDKEGAIYCMFHVGHHDDYRVLKNLSSRVSLSISVPANQNVQVTVQARQTPAQTTSRPASPQGGKKKKKGR
jgi:mRNA-degrading endonuclease RelE of RelBE toxin-antitoxin system